MQTDTFSYKDGPLGGGVFGMTFGIEGGIVDEGAETAGSKINQESLYMWVCM